MRFHYALVTGTLVSALSVGLAASPAPAAAASDRSACVSQVGTRTYRPSGDLGTLQVPNVYLRVGSTGACVRYAQRLIGSHGPVPGPDFVDGVFGSVTRTYVRAFQRNSGLPDDGIVGPNTWYWLMTIN
ncbi:peptidoglycan-binding domain-containing protein [Streptomyces sp. 4F14]|uniref:peptidoglycan-binding domain-containing protein n=1 Tax=Streptomyces sp. 4F14 TaxID=3394380 RepID=UPI003A8C544A